MGQKIGLGFMKLFLSFLFAFSVQVFAHAELPADCECKEIKCDPCMEQQGLSFYSQKCGGGDQVKSCAKPKCVPMDPLPARCKSAKKKQTKRDVASQKKVEVFRDKKDRGEKVATAQKIQGKVWVFGSGSQKMKLAPGTRLHEKDVIETEKHASVKVVFDDGNEFTMTPNTKLKIVRAKVMAAVKNRQTVLELIKGKVRSKVRKKYKGAGNYYRVKTRSAVAGVRGTDFVVSFSEGEKDVTTVSTLSGAVELANSDRNQKRLIEKNSKASFIIAANSSDVFSGDEVKDFIKKGFMTPVYKMNAREVADLDWSTQVRSKEERAIASAEKSKQDVVCAKPKGDLNQCSWLCENNPKGAKVCMIGQPEVRCVRRRCNANGQWAEESRVPASKRESCQPHGFRVAPCDY